MTIFVVQPFLLTEAVGAGGAAAGTARGRPGRLLAGMLSYYRMLWLGLSWRSSICVSKVVIIVFRCRGLEDAGRKNYKAWAEGENKDIEKSFQEFIG